MIKLNSLFLVGLLASSITLISCSEQSENYLPPTPIQRAATDLDSNERFDPRVDILFVVDDSGSMGGYQQTLIRNIQDFTQVFLAGSILDYNIGVVTSSAMSEDGRGKCCGKLVDTSSIRYVSRSTTMADTALKLNLNVGTGGSTTERFFEPVILALSPPHVDGHNLGFFRKDATLAIVFITDADDQSRPNVLGHSTDPIGFYNFLLGLKNGNERKVLSYGVIIPTLTGFCSRAGEDPPIKIEQFLDLVQNKGRNVLSLCDGTFGVDLAGFADDIVNTTASVVELSKPPVVESIRVFYGDAELPRDARIGWSFDSELNAIRLGREIDWKSQPPGAELRIFYDVATYPESEVGTKK